MGELDLYSVNWQDGMLITKQHLKDQEKYLEELVRWHALAVGDNYGLVRKSFSGKPALHLSNTVSGNQLKVEVVRCQALTPNGSYIEIDESVGEVVRAEIDISEKTVPVYVGVDPAAKRQIGDPDPEEDIPRIPYQINNYSVYLGQLPNLPQGQFVQVARLVINGSEVDYADDYYPPCITLNADDRVAQKSVEFRNKLESLQKLASRAFMAVTTAGALSGASTSLQVSFKETAYLILYHLSSTLDDFVVGRNAPHPLHMVIQFKKLFRIISSLLNLHPGLKDYLNERYFSKELKTEVGQFMSSIDAFLLSEYNHQDLGGQIKVINGIFDDIRGMLGFLAQTRPEELGEQAVATETLTYSGKTYRNVPYSASKLEQAGELSYLSVDVTNPRPVADTVALISKELFSDADWRNMQVRLGVNDARGLGETDPVDIDVVTFGNKVALHPRDMLKSSSVRQVTLIFRGARDAQKFANLSKNDLIIYAV
jgi:hypothetical protein